MLNSRWSMVIVFLTATVALPLSADVDSLPYLGELRYISKLPLSCQKAGLRYSDTLPLLTPALWHELLACPVRELVEKGYPFAKAEVESIKTAEDTVKLLIRVEAGERVMLVGIKSPETEARILERLSWLHFPMLYSSSRIEEGMRRLANSPYISLHSPWQIVKDERGRWWLRVRCRDRSINRLSGLIGYQSENEEWVGDISLVAQNMFRKGRGLSLNYSNDGGRRVSFGLSYSELLFPVVEPTSTFSWVKSRSWYTDQYLTIRLLYPYLCIGTTRSAPAFNLGFRRLSPDSFGLFERGIPASDEIELGLGLSSNEPLPHYPYRGIALNISAYLVRIRRKRLEEARSEKKPEEIGANLTVRVQYIEPLPTMGGLVLWWETHFSGKWRQAYTQADLIPLGGAKSLRGYPEEFFRGDRILLNRLELRLPLREDESSRLFAFADCGYYHIAHKWSNPKFALGFGAFLEPIGISYGVNPREDLSRGVIHLLLSTRF